MNPDEWIKIKDLFNATVELSVSKRQEFLSEVDHDTRAQVERLIDAHRSADDFIDEPALVDLGLVEEDPPDPHIGEEIDRYKIISEIGQGGMGTVYLANRADGSFDKPVAIKLIKRGMDTNAVLKRFVMERQILAQLQNPNIANLIDGGTTDDGLPYFVMEYVEGLPVTKYCSKHELSVNERLVLFRKICSPVSYAHQNLVIHRDIKPSNIIVTEDGTPKLLDFGIAKLLHPEWSLDTDEATATMFRVMTPEYASPEQVRGLPITTASDVYSLSVVLYELLCGERPLKISGRPADEAAQIVLAELPPKPSSVISGRSTLGGSTKTRSLDETAIQNPRSLRGDLDNIVMKGLAKEPSRRYQSVQEFSEDIRRHLEGLPVTATADSLSYRIDKFVRRHRTAVVAACLIFVTLAAATALTSWQYIVARRERDKAEQRFAQVRKLTHTILFEYHDEVVKLPGSTPLLERMVNNTLEYLDNLEVESNGDIDLESEIATAYQKVGDVQGNPYRGNLGNIEGAIASYRKSLAIREKLVREHPANADVRRNLAKSYESIGDMFWTKGDFVESVNAYRENLQIHSELAASPAGTVDDGYGIARARHRIGQALSRSGDPDGALESFQMGLAKFEEVTEQAPGEKRYQLGKGSVLLKIGDMLTAKEDLQKALDDHREALRIWSAIAAAEPLDSTLKRNLAIASERIAVDLKQLNQLPEALETMKRSIRIQQEISDADPKNVQFSSELGLSYVDLGSIEGKLKDHSAALDHVHKGLAILKQFTDASPQWIDLRRDLALAYVMAGEVFSGSGDQAEAAENYRKSAELLETAPLRAELRGRLAQNYMNIGDVERAAGHLPDARAFYQKALDIVGELKQEGKMSDTFHLDSLADKMIKCEAALAKAA